MLRHTCDNEQRQDYDIDDDVESAARTVETRLDDDDLDGRRSERRLLHPA